MKHGWKFCRIRSAWIPGMEAMYKALVLGEELPEDYELPQPEAITPDNIKDYDWQNWSWL